MLKRPTSRRKSSRGQIQLNLVPVIDTMVALIGFLLFTMSFLALVSIESPFPTASAKDVQQKIKDKPLQLTLSIRDNEAEIWSPFNQIPSKTIPNLSPGQPDVKTIHEALIGVKQKFPTETKIVLVPSGGINYDNLISAMDASRTLDPTDPSIYVKSPATGNDEPAKSLFPDVIFGNLLGESG